MNRQGIPLLPIDPSVHNPDSSNYSHYEIPPQEDQPIYKSLDIAPNDNTYQELNFRQKVRNLL